MTNCNKHTLTTRSGIIQFIKNRLMAKHTFQELRPRLEAALNQRIQTPGFLVDPQGYSLIEGFISVGLQDEIGNDAGFVIGGKSVPMVAIVGNSNGRVFYFAVTVLLPEVKF